MDVKLQWSVSDDVESLVAAIVECKKQLYEAAQQKYGPKTKLLSCDAYAGNKVLELLELSERWTACSEVIEHDASVPASRRLKQTTKMVADFAEFKLHRMTLLGKDDVRVIIIVLEPETNNDLTWIGNVELVTT